MTRLHLWAASGALAAVLLGSTAVITPAPPGAGAAASEVTAFYAAHRPALGLDALVFWLGATLLLVFAARLLKRLWIGPLPLLGFAAAAVSMSLLLVEDVTFEALAIDRGQPALEVLLNDLQNLLVSCSALPDAVFLASMGWGLRRCGSGRLGLAGLVAAAVQVPSLLTVLIHSGPLAAGGLLTVLAFAGLLGWLLVASIALMINPGEGSEAALPDN